MNPSQAKLIVQAAKWQLFPAIDEIPQSLQTTSPAVTQGVFAALGINVADSSTYGHRGTRGGEGHWVFGNAIAILAEAGAEFPERQRFLIGKAKQ
jgi:hypothetical protein